MLPCYMISEQVFCSVVTVYPSLKFYILLGLPLLCFKLYTLQISQLEKDA